MEAVDNPRRQDVGNIVLFEHLNLEVPDLEVARLFYSEGLGLTQDPGTLGADRGRYTVIWYNIGRQQFHICKGPGAQTLPPGGAIGLVLPDVDRALQRLESIQQALGDVQVSLLGEGKGQVSDPYGNTFILSSSDPYFPLSRGIAYIALPCHVGTASGIAQFYREVMGARVEEGSGSAEVFIGPGSRILFRELHALGQLSDEGARSLSSGWHIALYIARFSETYAAVEGRGLIDNDHAFRDKCHSLDDALRHCQFRLCDLRWGPSTPLLYRLSHEVRSLHHPRFARPLYNRGGTNFDV